MLTTPEHPSPMAHCASTQPLEPVLYFSKAALKERVEVFQKGLTGEVCYAVKCNPHPRILAEMMNNGIREFDVASPEEISQIFALSPALRMNYNNPIRSREEIEFALNHGIRSFSVDCEEELQKLAELAPRDCEVSVRLKLELGGSAYHFGDKFGETPEIFTKLLSATHALGFVTSATFHVGTQCEAPENYRLYIEEVARSAQAAGVTLKRINIGGGFPSARNGVTPDFAAFFAAIERGMNAFKARPDLLAEPGRALIADACQYVVRIKSIRKGRWAFLNDGVYGGLSDLKLMGSTPYEVYDSQGEKRHGVLIKYALYGPTCDSIDGFTEAFHFPESTKERDFLLFHGAGAYLLGLNTRFNGYGSINFEEVAALDL